MTHLICSGRGRMREGHHIAKPVHVSQQTQRGHTFSRLHVQASNPPSPPVDYPALPVVCRTDGSVVCPGEVVDRRAEAFGDCGVTRSLGRCSVGRSRRPGRGDQERMESKTTRKFGSRRLGRGGQKRKEKTINQRNGPEYPRPPVLPPHFFRNSLLWSEA
ncbi:hypothetical protein K469DRAFT_93896 [Zopfia rhizophila CBS 207.26]|uniref:Uncharacterized protein n=1 Tax=Zopfia rhizophila CBS 207.26 TaxID=1314779 RepID=A0A6A6ECQ0_9PEZI|nr:hypothetical protein K469DRAFT_93896 [Zopfia rhizophila CBS 207.26]